MRLSGVLVKSTFAAASFRGPQATPRRLSARPFPAAFQFSFHAGLEKPMVEIFLKRAELIAQKLLGNLIQRWPHNYSASETLKAEFRRCQAEITAFAKEREREGEIPFESEVQWMRRMFQLAIDIFPEKSLLSPFTEPSGIADGIENFRKGNVHQKWVKALNKGLAQKARDIQSGDYYGRLQIQTIVLHEVVEMVEGMIERAKNYHLPRGKKRNENEAMEYRDFISDLKLAGQALVIALELVKRNRGL